jgi:hypothetical protein
MLCHEKSGNPDLQSKRVFLFSDGFKTDSQISSGAKLNGEVSMKQLEEWQPDDIEESSLHDLHSGEDFFHSGADFLYIFSAENSVEFVAEMIFQNFFL